MTAGSGHESALRRADGPRGRRAGLAIAALALGGLGIGTGEFAPMGLLPELAGDLDVPLTSAGHLVSMYALGVVAGAPLLGVLGGQVRRRRLLILLMVAYAAGNLASAAAPSYGTLLAARFVSGMPHGAYFGVASLAAASLVEPHRRAWAVTSVMLGLAVANLAMVPLATAIGQALGWRSVFLLVAAIGAATALAVLRLLPDRGHSAPSMRGELGALRNPAVLLTLATGAIGFGGMFAVYAYITPTLVDRAGVSPESIPLFLFAWGAGMVVGNIWGGRAIDRRPLFAPAASLVAFAVLLALFPAASLNPATAAVAIFALGNVVLLGPALQTRLMDVAGDAQTLAASLHHAAFNAANALGPWLAGLAYLATDSWAAPAWVGVGLAIAGLVLYLISIRVPGRPATSADPPVDPGSRRAAPQTTG